MASIVLTDASLVVNSVNLSAFVRSVTLNYEAAGLEEQAMGDTFVKNIAGLTNWSMDVTFKQDFAASAPDVTLFALVGAAAFSCVLKPTSGSVSSTNPSFTGNAILTAYPVLTGSIGDLVETSITLQAAGALTRATS